MRPRTTLQIRINPKIKKEFLDAVKEKDLNICHIAEALFAAWIEGTKNRPPQIGITPGVTLNVYQTFEEVVRESSSGNVGGSRPRRIKRRNKPEDNCYSKKAGGIWGDRIIDSPSDVNKFGHHIHCECLDCSGKRNLSV